MRTNGQLHRLTKHDHDAAYIGRHLATLSNTTQRAMTYSETLYDMWQQSGPIEYPCSRIHVRCCHVYRYEYHNIFALLKDLGGPWPLTDWTTSAFWSPRGLVTEAPVFSKLQRLPTMLGQFVSDVVQQHAVPTVFAASGTTLASRG